MDRRSFLGVSALAAVAGSVPANAAPPIPEPEPAIPLEEIETIPLWTGPPPGSTSVNIAMRIWDDTPSTSPYHNRNVAGIARPALYVFRPEKPDGSALLILPGGGYRELQIDNEGIDVARRFSAAGATTFMLLYRLPQEGWLNAANVPLQDAQRAMRLIRFNASHFGIDAERVGVIGFSAGGHLAASLGTKYETSVYAGSDGADGLSAKPSFMALFYPVITMLAPYAHEASREMLLGDNVTIAQREAYSCERHVTSATPPAFQVAAVDDVYVPLENTLEMFGALRGQHVPVEMHLFERGGHGFGIHGVPGEPASAWPQLLLNWGASRDYFKGVSVAS
jgi:acetyl esterase/lipase